MIELNSSHVFLASMKRLLISVVIVIIMLFLFLKYYFVFLFTQVYPLHDVNEL